MQAAAIRVIPDSLPCSKDSFCCCT